MTPLRLRVLVFGFLLVPVLVVLRLLLASHVGVLVAAAATVLGLLSLLYRSMKTLARAIWEISGVAAEAVETAYRRRTAIKESSHATRLL